MECAVTDAEARAKRADLDAALRSVPPNVGIAFGFDLFSAFAARGWVTMEDFGTAGTALFSGRLPAYQRTHFAFVSMDVPDEDFQVGR
jgi:hypothetical protein